MRIYKKAILPKGFKANGIASGIKKPGKLDLALFYSDVPAKAASRFTTNKIQAATLIVNKEHLKKSRFFQAIIVNSGNANCFTGINGIKDARATAAELAVALGVEQESVLIGSTGIIGKRLPIEKIKRGIPSLVLGLSKEGIHKAKKAIMTTDTFSKEVTVQFNDGKDTVRVCGIAKGAGMIAPNMATMLSFIFTDANISQPLLNKALDMAVDKSFNCITVDGCMSTNDMVILMSNAKDMARPTTFSLFAKAVHIVCLELAKMIIQDAEGATKFIEISVKQAKDFNEAKKVALNIANSALFKTAMYGQNPNFGRIVAAIGASGIDVKEKDLKIKSSLLHKKEIKVEVSLKRGDSSATVYTSDLTPEYVKINAEYN